MAEPFWSQPDAVNDEVPVQADMSVPSVPQTTVGVGEQVIESDPTALFIGLGLLSICLVFLVIDALRGSPESSSQVGGLVFLVFLFSIAVSIKGLLDRNKVMVVSWDAVSHHLNVAFASRKLERRKTFFAFDMQHGDDPRFREYTDEGHGDDGTSTTSYWFEVYRRDGTPVVKTPTFSYHYWLGLRPILLELQGKVNAATKPKEVDSVQVSS
jgi:hypothetical protein